AQRAASRVQGAVPRRRRPRLCVLGGGGGEGGVEIDEAGSLGTDVGAGDRRCGLRENCLDLIGRERGALLQQVGNHAGDNGGGLARAAPAEERLRYTRGRVRRVDVGAGVAHADDRPAGRHDIRVARAVAPAGEVGDGVVGRGGRALGVVRADGDDERVRRGIGQVTEVGALVAGGGDNDDAVAPRHFGGV